MWWVKALSLALLVALAPRSSTPAATSHNPTPSGTIPNTTELGIRGSATPTAASPNPSPAATSLNPTPAAANLNPSPELGVLSNIAFLSQPHEKEGMHEVVSVWTVLQVLSLVREELALLRERHTTMQENQSSLEAIISSMQQTLAIYINNVATLQTNQFVFQDSVKNLQQSHVSSEEALQRNITTYQENLSTIGQRQRNLNDQHIMLQQTQSSFEEMMTALKKNITSLQAATSLLEQKQAILQDNQTSIKEAQDVLEGNVATLQHNQGSCPQMQDTIAGLEKNVTELQQTQAMETFLHDGQVFFVNIAIKLQWEAARRWCQTNWSGDLAQPTGDLNHFIQKVIDRVSGWTELWLGGNDREQEGRWVWPDGTVLPDQFPWDSDQPNDLGSGQDCLNLYIGSDGTGTMGDDSCSGSYNFVCGRSP